jgi:hypothetical protein
MALIALGFNHETLIATLFLILAVVFGGLTIADLACRDLDKSFSGFMDHLTTHYGPGVRAPKGKPSRAYVFFGILTLASFGSFLVTVFR